MKRVGSFTTGGSIQKCPSGNRVDGLHLRPSRTGRIHPQRRISQRVDRSFGIDPAGAQRPPSGVGAYDYLPYGQLMRSYGNDPTAGIFYRCTGQEWDEETGLYNYHARLYDPDIGRFYQPDPREQYFSPYKYVGNSPAVSLIDPDGEMSFVMVEDIQMGLEESGHVQWMDWRRRIGGGSDGGTMEQADWLISLLTNFEQSARNWF
jgi:RHS repeat-associated protein